MLTPPAFAAQRNCLHRRHLPHRAIAYIDGICRTEHLPEPTKLVSFILQLGANLNENLLEVKAEPRDVP